jgi:hypothetical protein
MASMATLALKSGLYCLRFLFNFLLLFILFILGAELYLNNLSSFRGPPQIDTSSLYHDLGISKPGWYNPSKWTGVHQKIVNNFDYIKNKIIESLLIDTKIFVIFNPVSKFTLTQEYTNYSLSTNDWLPLLMNVHLENGMTINLQNKSYQEYFKKIKSWEYYFLPTEADYDKEIKEFYKSNFISVNQNSIATNKLNKPLALEIYTFYSKTKGGEAHIQNSRLVILPASNGEIEEDVSAIINMTKFSDQTEIPVWANNIKIPNETKLSEEIEVIENKLKEKKDYYDGLLNHKKLIYDNSYSLQAVCELTLKELGANIKPSIVTDEFIVAYKGINALVEVKGKNKSIDKEDIGQLITDIGQHVAQTGEPIMGFFIGNGCRYLPPQDREKEKTLTFPKEIVHIAETQNIALLSSLELFNAYCMYLEGKLSKDTFLSKIFNSSGVIHF